MFWGGVCGAYMPVAPDRPGACKCTKARAAPRRGIDYQRAAPASMGEDGRDRVTVWAASELTERVDEYVEYGPPDYGSRSEWVREAMRFRMVFEDALNREGVELPDDQDAREAYLRQLAQAGLDAVGAPETDDEK